MWLVDFSTLVLIVAAGLQVGVQAIFGIDLARAIFGSYEQVVFVLMGLSAIWQLLRQRFH